MSSPMPALPFTGVLKLNIDAATGLETPKKAFVRVDIDGKTFYKTKAVRSVDAEIFWNETIELNLFKVKNVGLIVFEKRRLNEGDFVADAMLNLHTFHNEMDQVHEQSWTRALNLEPIGKLNVSFTLTKNTEFESLSFEECSNIFDNIKGGRVAEMQIHDYHGHKFKDIASNQFFLCSVCGHFSYLNKGRRCQVCDLITHTRCNTNIERTCIGTLGVETPVEVFRGDVTRHEQHQFEPHFFKSPTFCDHCGTMLYGLWRQGLKCQVTGCDANIHHRCKDRCAKSCVSISSD